MHITIKKTKLLPLFFFHINDDEEDPCSTYRQLLAVTKFERYGTCVAFAPLCPLLWLLMFEMCCQFELLMFASSLVLCPLYLLDWTRHWLHL